MFHSYIQRNDRNDRGGRVFVAYRDDKNVTEIANLRKVMQTENVKGDKKQH